MIIDLSALSIFPFQLGFLSGRVLFVLYGSRFPWTFWLPLSLVGRRRGSWVHCGCTYIL